MVELKTDSEAVGKLVVKDDPPGPTCRDSFPGDVHSNWFFGVEHGGP